MEERTPWNKYPKWDDAIERLRSILAKTELIEITKWGCPVFTVGNKNVIGIGGFKTYVGIWFFNGVFLKDELNILVNASEGVTKANRQWRFQSVAAINDYEKQILSYLKEAIENERAGLSSKPEKKETINSELFKTHSMRSRKWPLPLQSFHRTSSVNSLNT